MTRTAVRFSDLICSFKSYLDCVGAKHSKFLALTDFSTKTSFLSPCGSEDFDKTSQGNHK